ncbi:acyltransferase [Natronosalvus hydrolyticus]|uniref:acyltransferase n=1 Tax=Natronosalvus hydrolyticus TaxID=2979988 RepID=UPI00319D88F6
MSFTEVGESVYIGPNTTITPLGGETPSETLLRISDRATVSPNVTFLCSMHPEEARVPGGYGHRAPITVENDVWIGAGAIILAGVTLHKQSIVGAGAVVTKDVSSKSIVGGVPAAPLNQNQSTV